MGRESSLNQKQEISDKLEKAVNFQPTKAQIKAKLKFADHLKKNPLLDKSSLGVPQIQKIVGTPNFQKWTEQPGFLEWFEDQLEIKNQIGYLFTLALRAAENILLNEDPKAQGARVSLIKTISDLVTKQAELQKAEDENTTQAINQMSRKELEEFLQKQLLDKAGGISYNEQSN
jgi:hypothetical protein